MTLSEFNVMLFYSKFNALVPCGLKIGSSYKVKLFNEECLPHFLKHTSTIQSPNENRLGSLLIERVLNRFDIRTEY